MEEKEWIIIDNQNNHVLGTYQHYSEAIEVASTLEYYGLRCDIKENKKEN